MNGIEQNSSTESATTENKNDKNHDVVQSYLLNEYCPWIISVDNIFVDVTKSLEDNKFWTDLNILHGQQYTAHDAFFTEAALSVLKLKDGEYGSSSVSETVGGCSMNTSRCANFYLKCVDPIQKHRVFTSGSIGNDKQAELILKTLQEEGVTYDIHREEGAVTGTCAVTVVKVDRTCIAILDACKKYPTTHMENLLKQKMMNDSIILYSTAFFIGSNYKALLEMAKYAIANNKLFGFNFAAEFVYKYYKNQVFEMIEHADFIFCNRDESIACSRFFFQELGIEHSEDVSLDNLSKIAVAIVGRPKLHELRPRVMIITNSGEPVVCAVGAHKDQASYVFTQDAIQIDKELLKDSNAAGDSFVGGLLARICLIINQRGSEDDSKLLTKDELSTAIQSGNNMACEVLQNYGCSFPEEDKFRAILKNN